MGATEETDLATLLQRVVDGAEGAHEDLAVAVLADLRAMADRHLRQAFSQGLGGITLQPTALADDTFMRLIKQRQQFDNRGHFFAIATKLMLRVLADYHRHRGAAKRGGAWVRVPLDPDHARQTEGPASDVTDLAAALERLEALDARKADVVKLRVLWGLTTAEAATALGVGKTTVDRDWAFAKAWLMKELQGQEQ